MQTTKICLFIGKVTADSVSEWLYKYVLWHNKHTTIVEGKIHEIQFFGLQTLATHKYKKTS